MIEDIINKEQFEQNKPTINKEEKICCICTRTEKEVNDEGLKFVKMNDIYNKKFDEYLGVELSSSPKIKDAYVCSKCVEDTTTIIDKVINKSEPENLKEKTDSFTDYILSSSYLFNLDTLTVIQSCLNMFEAAIENLSETNPKSSKHIIKTSIIELERKLHELEKIPIK